MKTLDLTAAIALVVAMAGCAAAPAPVATTPTTQLAAAVVAVEPPASDQAIAGEVDGPPPALRRVQHHVEITVDELPAPRLVNGDAKTFVVWVRGSDEEAWANAANLQPSASAQVAELAYPENVLNVQVTAEASPEARTPSASVIVSTRVSTLAACASSVDENHLKMRVRMCRDE